MELLTVKREKHSLWLLSKVLTACLKTTQIANEQMIECKLQFLLRLQNLIHKRSPE